MTRETGGVNANTKYGRRFRKRTAVHAGSNRPSSAGSDGDNPPARSPLCLSRACDLVALPTVDSQGRDIITTLDKLRANDRKRALKGPKAKKRNGLMSALMRFAFRNGPQETVEDKPKPKRWGQSKWTDPTKFVNPASLTGTLLEGVTVVEIDRTTKVLK